MKPANAARQTRAGTFRLSATKPSSHTSAIGRASVLSWNSRAKASGTGSASGAICSRWNSIISAGRPNQGIVPASMRPATRDGWSIAQRNAVMLPIEWPASTARSIAMASMKATTSAAKSAGA